MTLDDENISLRNNVRRPICIKGDCLGCLICPLLDEDKNNSICPLLDEDKNNSIDDIPIPIAEQNSDRRTPFFKFCRNQLIVLNRRDFKDWSRKLFSGMIDRVVVDKKGIVRLFLKYVIQYENQQVRLCRKSFCRIYGLKESQLKTLSRKYMKEFKLNK